MRFSLLASKHPEYSALRAKSRALARVWQLGHGILCGCLLSLPGSILVWWVARDDPRESRNIAWAALAPVLVFAAVGVAVKRYAARQGGLESGPLLTRPIKNVMIALTGAALVVLPFVPLPLPLNARDTEAAASHAAAAVLQGRRVMIAKGFNTGMGYRRLEELHPVTGQAYCREDIGIREIFLRKHGLKLAPEDQRLRLQKGDVVISFTYQDRMGNRKENLQFGYGFGPLSGHGYEIRIYKSLLLRYFVYTHTWIS